MKKSEKFLIFFFCFLAVLGVNAQKTINIGAIIEDNNFLWTLESMDLYSDSTIITWKVKTKAPKIRMHLPQNVKIKDLNSGTIFQSSFIGEKVDSKNTVFFKREFEFQRFVTRFPAISDSTIISIFITPRLFIDSLCLESSSFFYDDHKYKVPVYNHAPLLTKKDSVEYSNELYYQGIDYYNKQFYQLAIVSFEKALSVERQLRSFELYWHLGDDFNESLWLSNCYFRLGEIDVAKNTSKDYFADPYDKRMRVKADSLFILSDTLYDEAKLKVLKEICELDSIAIGGNSFRFAESLYNLGRQYSLMREFKKARQTFEKARTISFDNYKEKNWLISHIYREFAYISYEENDIVSAIQYMKRSLIEERESTPIIEDSSMADDYKSLANYYSEVGDWENGLKTMEMLVKYWNDIYEKDPNKILWSLSWFSWDIRSAYNEILSDYAHFLNSSGYPKQALRIAQKCDYISDQAVGSFYYSLGDYNTALKYYELGKKNFLSLSSDNELSSTMLDYQNSIAIGYAGIGNIKKAIDIQRDIIQRNDSIIKVHSKLLGQWKAGYPTYATYLSNLARFYNLDNQYDSALVCEKKSLEMKLKYSPTNSEVAYSYMNIGYSYAGLKSWDRALANAYKAFKIYERNKDPEFYLRSLSILANCYYHLYDYANLEKCVISMEDVANQDLLNSLQDLTYYERSRFIEKYSGVLNSQIPMYAYYTKSDTLASATYNTCLTIKGALLSSENSVRRIIQESKDYELKDLWEELRADKYILGKQLEKDSLNRLLNTDSLQNVIYNLEDSLILKCKGYDDITKSMKLKWQDIQESLSAQDVAIEFLSFPIENDSVIYAALTLRKDDKSPKWITLFEENQLKNISDTLCYHSKDMTQLVWGPLLPELQEMKNIYFSPAGTLYNIGIEYLPGMEDYNIQVSQVNK